MPKNAHPNCTRCGRPLAPGCCDTTDEYVCQIFNPEMEQDR